MVISWLHKQGITSDMAYIAALGSIFLSIALWVFRRGEDTANAERFGIFVGLWAPTLAVLGRALEEKERAIKIQM
ncbi:MAG: hypothetical protein HC876_23505 [Chloroflexaceae bacterium]|nr:hypothetical protein [Chloroflexaceae bacterium]NJO08230.1 hypothetical protein [Chloroflexaceae bacterium]